MAEAELEITWLLAFLMKGEITMTPMEVVRNLRYQENKHRNDRTFTGQVVISDMAHDAANTIEELLNKLCWVPVEERLPLRPEYDWVLVKTNMFSGAAIPYVAELRNGVWYCGSYDEPMETLFNLKVVAWFDMQLLLNKEDI